MKEILKAVRIYAKVTLNPITVGFALFMMLGMLVAFIISPEPIGSEDYATMLSSVGLGHFGIFIIMIMGGVKINQNKFFLSLSCAEELYTTAPVIIGFIICLPYDIAIAVAAAANLGINGLSDLLVINSIFCSVMVLSGSGCGKKKTGLIWFAPYMALMTSTIWFDFIAGLGDGLGLTLGASLAAAAGIYAVGIALSVIMLKMSWKKGDRVVETNPVLSNLSR